MSSTEPPAAPPLPPPIQQEPAAAPANPDIQRFTRMLAVGVPLLAVEQKMRAEGYDPALLNSSNLPSPPQANESSTSEETDRSTSDQD